ncbi:hypothetical protein RHSIM_Rhsim04G0174100 [Rhododendron simsii]|uniref:Uncharacterized protein n=1 Tax=Rhododendron simsii TaxID=118357 RepID=A0A834H1X1_RHOSS|nr:hypothetical protein RHSIM_Rhsim04G0174100 [Rhododendron simsii]
MSLPLLLSGALNFARHRFGVQQLGFNRQLELGFIAESGAIPSQGFLPSPAPQPHRDLFFAPIGVKQGQLMMVAGEGEKTRQKGVRQSLKRRRDARVLKWSEVPLIDEHELHSGNMLFVEEDLELELDGRPSALPGDRSCGKPSMPAQSILRASHSEHGISQS